ncbi:hypothetical protein BaOVIS_020850 [Babesia ovis]|uniref:Uncharacterized protein n=1 Tax=Babesia ovis TaxID=5869 RepID=A0A9W5TC81_BABOV|nr:hypothetical protein BaOVIS_020850 [Babesia ovis]
MSVSLESRQLDDNIVFSASDSDDEDYTDSSSPLRRKVRPSGELHVHEDRSSTHLTSRLFEIVIMRRHAKLSTCLQRLLLTLGSNERHMAIADILSFICECAGFRHSSISPNIIASPFGDDNSLGLGKARRKPGRKNKPKPDITESPFHTVLDSTTPSSASDSVGGTTEEATTVPGSTAGNFSYNSFNWTSFLEMFSQLPTSATYDEIVKHTCARPEDAIDQSDSLLYLPEIGYKTANILPKCLSSKFLNLCLERVDGLTSALHTQDGWTIGFGKKNVAFLRFKEFFQQLVLEAEASSVGDLLHALQWIFALSLIGFRAVRQYAFIACNEIVASLLVKLNALSKNERVFKRQLEVELEMDQRTHERVHGRSTKVSLNVSKSSIEVYKKLLLAQRGQNAINAFVKCVFCVNFSTKLQDVLLDIRVSAAFSLVSNLLLCPKIFSETPYIHFVYHQLPTTDETTRLLLLRYLAMVDRRINEEQFGILLSVHAASMRDNMAKCCDAIEALFLRDIHQNFDCSVVAAHKNDKDFMALVNSLSRTSSTTLCVLVASLYMPSVRVSNYTTAFQASTDDLRSKYRNLLIPHPAVVGLQQTLRIHEDNLNDHEMFNRCFVELNNISTSVDNKNAFVSNMVVGLWHYNRVFTNVGNIIRYICQAGDIDVLSINIDETGQEMLLHMALASLEHMFNVQDEDTGFRDLQLDAVSAVTTHGALLLRLFQASRVHTRIVLNLLEIATAQLQRTGLPVATGLIGAVKECITQIISNMDQSEFTIDSLRLGIRVMYNVYTDEEESRLNVSELYNMLCGRMHNPQEANVVTLHCIITLLHYLPLEIESSLSLSVLIRRNLESLPDKNHLLWCGIGFVLFESELYKCVKTSRTSVDPAFCDLRDSILRAISGIINSAASDCIRFVCFSSIAALVQISALVNLEDIPEGVDADLYRVMHYFLVQVRQVHARSMASNGKIVSSPIYKKGITISDVFINGNTEAHFRHNCLESLLCLNNMFMRSLSARLYCSGASVLLFLQLLSGCQAVCDQAGNYIRFLANFDEQILISLLLAALFGLYESNSRPLTAELGRRFVQQLVVKQDVLVDHTKLNVDKLFIAILRYGVHAPSNWDFLPDCADLIKMLKHHGCVFNKQRIEAQIQPLVAALEPHTDIYQKASDFFEIVGINNQCRITNATEDLEDIDRCVQIIRSKSTYLQFDAVIDTFGRRKPGKPKVVKRPRVKQHERTTTADTRASSEDSSNAQMELSPVLMRTFTKSHMNAYPPSVGILQQPSTDTEVPYQTLSGSHGSLDLDYMEFDQMSVPKTNSAMLPVDPMATPTSEDSSGMRSTPNDAIDSYSSSVMSPLMLPY